MIIYMNIITQFKATEKPSELDKEALEVYFWLFSNRIDYGYRANATKKYSRIIFKTYEGKMPKVLPDKFIEKALLHEGDKQYCVSFNNKYNKELKKYFPNCKYAVLDVDDTSIYFNNLEIITKAFSKYNITICWYPSTVNNDGSINGWHGYIFFTEEHYYQRISALCESIANKEGLRIGSGCLEIFPNVPVDTGKKRDKDESTARLQHRLPCQEKFGVSLIKFSSDAMNKKSAITREEIDDISLAFYKGRKSNRFNNTSKYSESEARSFVENLKWTGEGETQDNVFKVAYFYRKSGISSWKELFDKVYDVVINAPDFAKYSKHTEDIEKVITNKVNYVLKKYQAGWQYKSREFIKRKTKKEELLSRIISSVQNGNINANQVHKDTGLALKTVYSYFKLHNAIINEYIAKVANDKVSSSSILKLHNNYSSTYTTYTPSLEENNRCVVRKSRNYNVQNEKQTIEERLGRLAKQILKLNKEDLHSVLNTKGNVNISALAKVLGCHRNSIKLTKDELTGLITSYLNQLQFDTPDTPDIVNTLTQLTSKRGISPAKEENVVEEVMLIKKPSEVIYELLDEPLGEPNNKKLSGFRLEILNGRETAVAIVDKTLSPEALELQELMNEMINPSTPMKEVNSLLFDARRSNT